MTATATRAGVVPREAAALSGVAWAYLSLLSTGSGPAATAVLALFRELYNENRSAVVAALPALAIVTAEQAERTLPRTLTLTGPVTRADVTAVSISIYPMLELGRLNASRLSASSFQGEAGDSSATPYGSAEELRAVFASVGATESALRTWFSQLTAILPRASSDPYARQLWWFANNAAAGGAGARDATERAFLDYIFRDADAGADRSTITQSARAVTAGTSTPPVIAPPIIEAPATESLVELDPTVITVRASPWRSPWVWLAIGAGVVTVGGVSWWVYSRRSRRGRA